MSRFAARLLVFGLSSLACFAEAPAAPDPTQLVEFRRVVAAKALANGSPEVPRALLALEQAGFLPDVLEAARLALGGNGGGAGGGAGPAPKPPSPEQMRSTISSWQQRADLSYNTPTSYEELCWARPNGQAKVLKVLPPQASDDGSVPTWSVQISLDFYEQCPRGGSHLYETRHFWLKVDPSYGQVLEHESTDKDKPASWLAEKK